MIPWKDCRKILCVRPDNMGDVLMSAPAMAALRETFKCELTLLTSSMANGISAYIKAVDNVIELDVPWVKGPENVTHTSFSNMIEKVRQEQFDAAVIFTVFSQSPFPSALLTTLAGIPNRLAYCRENPYHLLSHWIPDEEPYHLLKHQTRRDLDLVRYVGAQAAKESITIQLPKAGEERVKKKLAAAGAAVNRPWVILHTCASERKREWSARLWIETGRQIVRDLGHQVILTGTANDQDAVTEIVREIGTCAFSVAGMLSLEELIGLLQISPLLISVNTGPVHIAAAVQTPVIVLYALTNPQHAPWQAIGKVLPFSVPENLQSRNEVLRFVRDKYFSRSEVSIAPDEVCYAAHELLIKKKEPVIEELVLPFTSASVME